MLGALAARRHDRAGAAHELRGVKRRCCARASGSDAADSGQVSGGRASMRHAPTHEALQLAPTCAATLLLLPKGRPARALAAKVGAAALGALVKVEARESKVSGAAVKPAARPQHLCVCWRELAHAHALLGQLHHQLPAGVCACAAGGEEGT